MSRTTRRGVLAGLGTMFATIFAARGQTPDPKEKDGDSGNSKGSSKKKTAKKGRPPAPAAVQGGTGDPRALALRFGGRVGPGEPGFKPGWSAYRLRLGPGDWSGTLVRDATAFGDGNMGKDHWGKGSGSEAHASDVYRDAQGSFFVLSLVGDNSDSNWIAGLFHTTLADGTPGVATATFPYR